MKSSLSGSTYILLTTKSSIDTYTLPKLSNTQEKMVVQVPSYDKKKHSYQRSSSFLHFRKISDQLVDENPFKNDLLS